MDLYDDMDGMIRKTNTITLPAVARIIEAAGFVVKETSAAAYDTDAMVSVDVAGRDIHVQVCVDGSFSVNESIDDSAMIFGASFRRVNAIVPGIKARIAAK